MFIINLLNYRREKNRLLRHARYEEIANYVLYKISLNSCLAHTNIYTKHFKVQYTNIYTKAF